MEGPVPQHIAETASDKAQEEEVAGNGRGQKGFRRVGAPLQQHQGQGGEDAPEQSSPGDQKRVQSVVQAADQHGIDGPAGGSSQSQQVAPGIQLQYEGAVAHHQNDTGESHQKAQQRTGAEPLYPGNVSQDGGEDGSRGHDDADIGGQGVGQGRILCVEVK